LQGYWYKGYRRREVWSYEPQLLVTEAPQGDNSAGNQLGTNKGK